MRRTLAIFAAAFAVATCADFSRCGETRDISYPGMKIRIQPTEKHGWEIREDAPLFSNRFATLEYPEYHVNYAESKLLAIEVAKTIASFLGSTNDIRIVHWEQPEPASTNLIDRIDAWLNGCWITDDTIPSAKKGGSK